MFKKYFEQAEAAEKLIAQKEDKEIFHNDLIGGKWFGLK
jgi:streptomycin 6-kinase